MNAAKHLPADSATGARFGACGLRWQTYLHFARHLAAESAGGSVWRHCAPVKTGKVY
jgi:hypothetical protein